MGGNNSKNIYNKFQPGYPEPEFQESADSLERGERSYQNPGGFNKSYNYGNTPIDDYPKGGNINQEIQALRAQNEDYRNQIALLEISLHNETLTNEEQRAYIEVLKQALEVKMNETGLMNFIRGLSQKSNLTETDLFIEMNNLKTLIDATQKEKQINEEQVQELYKQMEQLSEENQKLRHANSLISTDNQNLSNEMNKLLDTLALLQDENQKLNQEKDSLLDYIEEMRGKFDQITEENSKSQETIENLESQLAASKEKVTELAGKLKESEEKNYDLSKRAEELEKNHNELEKKYIVEIKEAKEVTANNLKRLEVEISTKKEEYTNLEKQFYNLEKAYQDQEEKVKALLQDNDQLKSIIEDYDQELKNSASRIKQLEVDSQEQRAKITNLLPKASEYDVLKQTNQSLELQIGDLENEVKYYQGLYEELKTKSEKDRQAKAEELKGLYEQVSALRSELRALKEENLQILSNKDQMEKELIHLREDMEQKHHVIATLTKDMNEMKRQADAKQEELDRKISQIQKFESEVQDLNNFVEECDQKLQVAYDAKEKLLKDLETLSKDNSKYKEQNKTLNRTIEELNSTTKRLSAENERLHRVYDALEKNIRHILQAADESHYSVRMENIDTILTGLTDKIKNLSHERDSLRRKAHDLTSENNSLKSEISLLEAKIDKLQQEEKDYLSENKGLRSELEFLKDEINEHQLKNTKLSSDFEKLRDEFERRIKDEEKNFLSKVTSLEDKVSKLVAEKSALEYLLHQYREVTVNQEIVDLLEEAKNCHNQISNLEKEVLDIQVKLDMYERAPGSRRNSPQKTNDPSVRRIVEELKDNLKEIKTNIEIYETKQKSIEDELIKIQALEKQRYLHYFDMERENKQLKTELEIILKENDLLGQAKNIAETSYNDLLKDLKRTTKLDERSNLSFHSDSFRKERFNNKVDFDKVKPEEYTRDTGKENEKLGANLLDKSSWSRLNALNMRSGRSHPIATDDSHEINDSYSQRKGHY